MRGRCHLCMSGDLALGVSAKHLRFPHRCLPPRATTVGRWKLLLPRLAGNIPCSSIESSHYQFQVLVELVVRAMERSGQS